ncbi:Rossmann-like and DUF2520 domain-containing protein [Anaerovorax odorimutans]
MKIGFIGSGKVGFSLGKYFADNGLNITGYYSKTLQSAIQAAKFTNTSYYHSIEHILEVSDTLFITTPDGVIKEIWDYIKKLSIENKIICHCSGSLSSTVFSQIDTHGAYGYSIHPLQAISDKNQSYKTLSNCLFTIEGSSKRMELMQSIFHKLGNTIQVISAENKTLYHAAAVTVSNHMIALFKYGIDMLIQCGFNENNAAFALLPLMTGNLKNLQSQNIVSALTGPIERCDIDTVKSHLSVLSLKDKQLYLLLCSKLIPLAKLKNPDRNYTNLENLINGGLNN